MASATTPCGGTWPARHRQLESSSWVAAEVEVEAEVAAAALVVLAILVLAVVVRTPRACTRPRPHWARWTGSCSSCYSLEGRRRSRPSSYSSRCSRSCSRNCRGITWVAAPVAAAVFPQRLQKEGLRLLVLVLLLVLVVVGQRC